MLLRLIFGKAITRKDHGLGHQTLTAAHFMSKRYKAEQPVLLKEQADSYEAEYTKLKDLPPDCELVGFGLLKSTPTFMRAASQKQEFTPVCNPANDYESVDYAPASRGGEVNGPAFKHDFY